MPSRPILSRGARLCEQIIRTATSRKGARQVGRPYLARRLGCSTRTVSRYTAELIEAGRLDRIPPRKVRTAKGWACVGTNTYRLPCSPHPAPHVLRHPRRSGRGDTPVTPSPYGDRRGGAAQAAGPPVDATAAVQLALARLTGGGGRGGG